MGDLGLNLTIQGHDKQFNFTATDDNDVVDTRPARRLKGDVQLGKGDDAYRGNGKQHGLQVFGGDGADTAIFDNDLSRYVITQGKDAKGSYIQIRDIASDKKLDGKTTQERYKDLFGDDESKGITEDDLFSGAAFGELPKKDQNAAKNAKGPAVTIDVKPGKDAKKAGEKLYGFEQFVFGGGQISREDLLKRVAANN